MVMNSFSFCLRKSSSLLHFFKCSFARHNILDWQCSFSISNLNILSPSLLTCSILLKYPLIMLWDLLCHDKLFFSCILKFTFCLYLWKIWLYVSLWFLWAHFTWNFLGFLDLDVHSLPQIWWGFISLNRFLIFFLPLLLLRLLRCVY